MSKYLGAVQLAECPRCGDKMPAKDLRKDGDNPALLVCRSCYDPPHPADLPFSPRANEGKPRWPVAPDNWPVETGPVPIASSLVVVTPGSFSSKITWLPFANVPVTEYQLWERKFLDGAPDGDFALAVTYTVDLTLLWLNPLRSPAPITPPYNDPSFPGPGTYSVYNQYFVRGLGINGGAPIDTNTVQPLARDITIS